MTGRLAGKTAIVVGAGQLPGEAIGNGRAIATVFGREGANVLCVDRELKRAEETALDICQAGGVAAAVRADIANAEDVARIFATVADRFGGFDILVNNVGITFTGPDGDGPADRASEFSFDRSIEVNVKGTWLTIKAALPILSQGGGGAIVNISSIEAISGHSLMSYELSKAAVNRLTVAVAMSHAAHGIRSNAILPGTVHTPLAVKTVAEMTGLGGSDIEATLNQSVPLKGGMGTAWDTANAALFLASDEARFITGVLLAVDGGATARMG